MAKADGVNKLFSKLGSTLKNPVTWGVTAAAGTGATASLLATQAINAGRESPDVIVVNQPTSKTTPDGLINEKTDNSLADMMGLMYLMNMSNGGGGGNNSEPETPAENSAGNIREYLPWVVGLVGVGVLVYLLVGKKKGRR